MLTKWKQNFFLIWCGQALSDLSSSIVHFAIFWYINDLTGSDLSMAIGMLIGFLPRVILGPFMGVFIDRYNRKKIMIISDLFIAGASLIPMIVVLANGTVALWVIYVVLLLRALGTAFHQPTLKAVTPQLVPADHLVKYSGFSQSVESVSMIISPFLSAILYAYFSISRIIMLDVAGALVAVFILFFVTIPRVENLNTNKLDYSSVLKETKEGYYILKEKRGLFGLVFISSLYSLALMPISALFPRMCTGFFGGTASHTAFVETVFAVGLLIGGVIISFFGKVKNKIYPIIFSYFLMSGSLLIGGTVASNQFSIFVISAFFMGLSGPFFWGMYNPLLQQNFKEEHLGRVMAISSAITVIASPVGMIISGVYSQLNGTQSWFIIAAIMTFVCGVLCLRTPSIRQSGFTKDVTTDG